MIRLALSWLLLWLPCALPAAAEKNAELAVVVSSRDAPRTLDLELLARIYRRKTLYWPDGRKIEPVNLPASEPLRQLFSRRVLKMEPEELEAYWNQQYFQGVFPPFMLPSEEAVIRFVADTPGAVGYVSACAIDARVTVLVYLRGDEASPHAANRACPH
ncbi:hypothetical protein [Methylogaea oryzae]|uniref:PBP domain-containing protein n=1 Tax=Methylogaea oryzae TaxID=1295382 RepID=A0A8D5ALG7_9GAMM|nr:hypothetical protein [Methylogaea oryzae]BBL70110.1 hypothetical protein MoryE10_07160 [Methylogaea oryzae]